MSIAPWLEVCISTLHRHHATDIFFNSSARGYALTRTNGPIAISPPFTDGTAMTHSLQDLAFAQGLRLDPHIPFCGGRIKSSYRWHAVIPPTSGNEPIFAIRLIKAQQQKLHFHDPYSLEPELSSWMKKRRNILICGPTGSGKTTLLTRLLSDHAIAERVIILEDAKEIPTISDRWVHLITQQCSLDGHGGVGFNQLIAESLRLRPDRIVCGEIRTLDSIKATESLLLGHGGTMMTLHGDGPQNARSRMHGLWKNAGIDHTETTAGIWGVVLERGDPPSITDLAKII